jgi:hypothetical protein
MYMRVCVYIYTTFYFRLLPFALFHAESDPLTSFLPSPGRSKSNLDVFPEKERKKGKYAPPRKKKNEWKNERDDQKKEWKKQRIKSGGDEMQKVFFGKKGEYAEQKSLIFILSIFFPLPMHHAPYFTLMHCARYQCLPLSFPTTIINLHQLSDTRPRRAKGKKIRTNEKVKGK